MYNIYNLFTIQNDLHPALICNEQKDTKLDIHGPYPKLTAEVTNKSTQISVRALMLWLLLLLWLISSTYVMENQRAKRIA